MTVDLAPKLQESDVTVNALHPATYMPTKMVKGMFGVQSTLEEGVANVVRLLADPSLAHLSGRYFNCDSDANADAQAYDKAAQDRLRQLSEKLCAPFMR